MKTEIYAALRKWYCYQSGYSNFRFGYKEFRSRQYGLPFFSNFHVDAIRLILEGSDVVVLMPTGGMSLTSVLLHRREVPVLPNPSPRSKWALRRRFSSDRPHARPAYPNLSLSLTSSPRTSRTPHSLRLSLQRPVHLRVSQRPGFAPRQILRLPPSLRHARAPPALRLPLSPPIHREPRRTRRSGHR